MWTAVKSVPSGERGVIEVDFSGNVGEGNRQMLRCGDSQKEPSKEEEECSTSDRQYDGGFSNLIHNSGDFPDRHLTPAFKCKRNYYYLVVSDVHLLHSQVI